MYYIYVVLCADGTLYTGFTTDIPRRVRMHNEGKGARYTRARLPVTLVYTESYPTKQEAMQREYEFKHLTRAKKRQIIESNSSDTSEFTNENK